MCVTLGGGGGNETILVEKQNAKIIWNNDCGGLCILGRGEEFVRMGEVFKGRGEKNTRMMYI